MIPAILERLPYLTVAVLAATGVYLLIAHRNLLLALVGVYLMQLGIILFFILISVHREGTVPILSAAGTAATAGGPLHNALPHALMLTAIVVGVATLGVGLGILMRMREEEATIQDRPGGSAQ